MSFPSLDSMAGQRMLVGFDGTELTPSLTRMIRELRIAGVILFSRNIRTPEQVADLCGAIREEARAAGLPPPIIAVDQEGGPVARLKGPGFTEFPAGNPGLADEAAVDRFAAVTASELLRAGFTMNLAPVLDVASRDGESVMAARAFPGGPGDVARLGVRLVRELQARGIMAVAKHFPGIGRTILDSHHELPVLDDELENIAVLDLPPFAAAIAADVAGVMLSHILYPRLDPDWPASLSRAIAGDLLRRRMGYRGLVMTDDLDMGAITGHYGLDAAVPRILAAEIDLLLVCHETPRIEEVHGLLTRHLRDDAELRSLGMASLGRLTALRNRFPPSIPA